MPKECLFSFDFCRLQVIGAKTISTFMNFYGQILLMILHRANFFSCPFGLWPIRPHGKPLWFRYRHLSLIHLQWKFGEFQFWLSHLCPLKRQMACPIWLQRHLYRILRNGGKIGRENPNCNSDFLSGKSIYLLKLLLPLEKSEIYY